MRSKPFIFRLSGDLFALLLLYWHSGIIISVTSLPVHYISSSRKSAPVILALTERESTPFSTIAETERQNQSEPMIRRETGCLLAHTHLLLGHSKHFCVSRSFHRKTCPHLSLRCGSCQLFVKSWLAMTNHLIKFQVHKLSARCVR